MQRLLAKIRRSLARDADLPVVARAAKARDYLLASLMAPVRLRGSSRVGARARVAGPLVLENEGTLDIGDDLLVFARYAPVELIAREGARLVLESDVHINYGTSLRARASVRIGRGVSIGPYCIVDDSDGDADATAPVAGARPIEIDDEVWLAARVTVLPGAHIGARSVITAGSIVSGEIPADVVAGGIPARVLRPLTQRSPAAGASSAEPASPAVADAPRHETASASVEPAAQRLRGRVLADFTAGDLAVHLASPRDGLALEVVEQPYAQTAPYLLGRAPTDATDFLIVWSRPEIMSPSFARLAAGEPATEADLIADARAHADLVTRGAAHYRHTFVPSLTLPAWQRGLGMLDLRPGGLAWGVAVLNRELMRALESSASVFMLDAQRWASVSGQGVTPSAKGWYLGKVPFSSALFAEAALDVKAAIRGALGQARKLLVLDLDDTLWGGIVGDAGWENLQLGGHNGEGEAFVEFQRAIKTLTRRGIVLGIVSKNTESVALEAMRSHPEMVLRPEDFVGWRINWSDKAQNIADLAAELNLGLQSVVFIDDNPVERARVREALPEVYVPDWPEDKLEYVERLLALRCFDVASVSSEDASRTRLYAAERERAAARDTVGSLDDWLASLDIRVRVDPLDDANLARVHQLLNKTNQMNLSTRRLTEPELVAWNGEEDHAVFAITVSDRFGSAGLTGILGLAREGTTCEIVDFVLSCRVMGRRVEDAMLHVATAWAAEQGASMVRATYRPTKKNKPCLDMLEASALARDETGTQFTWQLTNEYRLPPAIRLEWHAAAGERAAAG